MQSTAAQLAGLGVGLTPAGDDFLTGVMIWAWVAHADPEWVCRFLVEASASRTTALSAAFLRAAARGECAEAWHVLLAALRDGDQRRSEAALGDVIAHGHTSGADAVAGLFWMVR
jgi:hypothetical protein